MKMSRQEGKLFLPCVILFIFAAVIRIAVLVLAGEHPAIRVSEQELIGKSLALHGTFADPYAIPTGPTAHHAPVYPFLLSLIFRCVGFGAAAAYAVVAMNMTFACLQVALLPVLGKQVNLPAVGLVAGLWGAAIPWRGIQEVQSETALTSLCLLLAVMASVGCWRSNSIRSSALCGAAWGLLFLVSPSPLPAFLLVLIVMAIQLSPQRALLSACAAAVVLLPWCVRNYVALGGFTFVRDNFPIEFHISNNDFATAVRPEQYYRSGSYVLRMHPHFSVSEARIIATDGELAYNRAKRAETLAWIHARPDRFAWLTAQRILYFWILPSQSLPWKAALFVPIELMALAGVLLLIQDRNPAGVIFACVLLGYPIVYYLVQVESRYHYPLDCCTYFLAVACAFIIRRRVLRGRTKSATNLEPNAAS